MRVKINNFNTVIVWYSNNGLDPGQTKACLMSKMSSNATTI